LEAEEVEEVGVAIKHSKGLNNPMEEVDAAAVKCLVMAEAQEDIINSNNSNHITMTLEWNNNNNHNKVIHTKDRSSLTCREVVEVEGRIHSQPTKIIKDLLLEMFLISRVDVSAIFYLKKSD
jgi:hypothetical protein